MAWNALGNTGTDSSNSAGTTLTWDLSDATALGQVCIIAIAFDNTSTTDGETNEVLTVTDDANNDYTKLGEYVNGQGGAAAGIGMAIFYSKHAHVFSGSGTVTFANTVTAKSCSQRTFTIGAGNVVTIQAKTTGASDAAAPGSLDLSVPNGEYLWFRGIGFEADWGGSINPGATANFTNINGVSGGGGTDATSAATWGEFRIFTGTSNASNPGGTISSWDTASVYLALKEAPAETPAIPSLVPRRTLVRARRGRGRRPV